MKRTVRRPCVKLTTVPPARNRASKYTRSAHEHGPLSCSNKVPKTLQCCCVLHFSLKTKKIGSLHTFLVNNSTLTHSVFFSSPTFHYLLLMYPSTSTESPKSYLSLCTLTYPLLPDTFKLL